jgi:ATP/maltotriose-dependent transcriptional regulator MalT
MRAYAERRLTLENPEAARELNLQAASHLEAAGEWLHATTLYLKGGHHLAASRTIRSIECRDLNSSICCLSEDWIRLLPDNLADYPWLRVVKARRSQTLGQFANAAQEFEHLSTEFLRLGDTEASVKCLLISAFDSFASGDVRSALQLTERAYRSATDKRQRIECLVVLGNLYSELCEWDKAVEYLENAVAQVSNTERSAIEARVGVARSKIFYYRGSFHTAARWARKSLTSNQQIPRVLLAGSLNQACAATILVGDYEESLVYGQLGLKIATDYSLLFLQSCLLLNLGDAFLGHGMTAEGVRTLRTAERLNATTGNATHLAWGLDLLADLYRRNGNFTRMLALREQAIHAVSAASHPIDHLRISANRGFDLAVMGRHAEATEELARVLSLSSTHELHSISIPIRLYLGWLQALQGDESSAVAYLAQAIDGLFSNHHIHFILQEARCATPILALCCRYRLSADVETYIIPRLPTLLAKYYKKLSDGPDYPTDFRLGPPKLSRIALTRPGAGPDYHEDVALATRLRSLTTRERQILQLVSLGLPNKAIARELFITEKTVKTHTNHIFEKLSVTNRVQAGIIFREYQGRC